MDPLALLLVPFVPIFGFVAGEIGDIAQANLEPKAGTEIVENVGRVIDGDTFIMGDGIRIRLHGIDAPELRKRYGKDSRQHLVVLIEDRTVRCVLTGSRSFNRHVAICFLGRSSEIDLSAFMVNIGWAQDWIQFSGGRYAADEKFARAEERGMWATKEQ